MGYFAMGPKSFEGFCESEGGKSHLQERAISPPSNPPKEQNRRRCTGEPRGSSVAAAAVEEEVIYRIDAAKKMKHEELIPIESRNQGGARDRVKEKADRHCKRIWPPCVSCVIVGSVKENH